MKIEKVSSKDLKQVMALEQSIFKENAFSRELMERFYRYSKKGNNTLFLKLELHKRKNELIGFIIVVRDRIDRANIVNFLISQKYQHKGCGNFLLKHTLENIKQMEYIKSVVLNVQVNNINAINLYEKFNFKKNPNIIENYYQSGESSYLMELFIER
ncbi:MAG: GNAT family N-acetyltransferase [Candidatus Thorarchaeota archaeon]